MNLSDLQLKEIIDISSGKRLGTIVDVIIDSKGSILKLLLDNKRNRSKLFVSNKEEYFIEWKNIIKLGDDIILVDTSHLLDEICLMAIDESYMSAYVITNDLVDLKNMKSLVSIFKEMGKENYKIVLNNSRDTGRDYISNFDIRNMIKRNIDYTISRNFYIKNIDKYVLNGDILTLNKTINRFNSNDIKNLNNLALSLIRDKERDGN